MKYPKLLCFLFILLLASSALFASGSQGGSAPDTIELEIMMPFFGGSWDGTVVKDAWYDMMEARLGKTLDITWRHIPWGEYEDKVNISLAANDFPDMMEKPATSPMVPTILPLYRAPCACEQSSSTFTP